MAIYEYKIATEAEGVGGLKNIEDELSTPVNPPHPATPTEWPVTYEAMDGQEYGDGYPSQVWHFDYLSQAMANELRTYCTARSAIVYLRTRKVDGSGAWANYKAVMVWPASIPPAPGSSALSYRDVDVLFKFMEEQ